ncbi:hypothetical protein L1987_16351 [Smallanthus sonchifolius]|uniref:Uncharacterized protein n=1 Tax=Smallanthus sonchifolius TaxID=185202 RepID=A0ACB9JAD3_9ASTR|nr:hypothetical protein L1987_16351 [Smallanthus sonchifolius]
MLASVLISNPCGTRGYIDPDYLNNGHLTQKTDVWLAFLSPIPVAHVDILIQTTLTTAISPKRLTSTLSGSYCGKFCAEGLLHRTTMTKPEREIEISFLPPPPRPQDFVFSVFMHCEDCARRVRRCIKGFAGVESVETDCYTGKVVVKGEKADPIKVLEKIKKETKRQVVLLSPDPKPSAEEAEELKQEEHSKRKDKKDEEGKKTGEGKKAKKEAKPAVGDEKKGEESTDTQPPPRPQEFVFKVFMYCEGCARKVRQCLLGFEGVESVVTDFNAQKIIVKGEKADPLKVLERIHKETQREVELLSPDSKVPTKSQQKG